MSLFSQADQAGTDSIFDIVGETASYHQHTGIVSTVRVVPDYNVEYYPSGGFESSVAERRTELEMLVSEVSSPQRGEMIVTDNDTFELVGPVEGPDDGVVVRWVVK